MNSIQIYNPSPSCFHTNLCRTVSRQIPHPLAGHEANAAPTILVQRNWEIGERMDIMKDLPPPPHRGAQWWTQFSTIISSPDYSLASCCTQAAGREEQQKKLASAQLMFYEEGNIGNLGDKGRGRGAGRARKGRGRGGGRGEGGRGPWRCYNCQQPGHISRNCPQNRGAMGGYDEAEDNDTCYPSPPHVTASNPQGRGS